MKRGLILLKMSVIFIVLVEDKGSFMKDATVSEEDERLKG